MSDEAVFNFYAETVDGQRVDKGLRKSQVTIDRLGMLFKVSSYIFFFCLFDFATR